MYDVTLLDYPRLPGETDDSPRIGRAINDAPNGIVEIPKGEYEIASPIRIRNRASLEMHPAAHLKAVREMDFVLDYDGNGDFACLSVFDENGDIYDNLGLFIHGGDIDGNGLASCLTLSGGHHFTVRDIALHNGKKYGLFIGGADHGRFYEIYCTNVYCKCNMSGLAGSVGICCRQFDCHFTDCTVVDYTVGVDVCGSTRLTRCHVWGGTVPPKGKQIKEWSDLYGKRKHLYYDCGQPLTAEFDSEIRADGLPEMLIDSIAFSIHGNAYLDGCYADTASVGFLVECGAILSCCGFFNNPLMGLRDSVAFRHTGGTLAVMNSEFHGAAGTERLYEGIGKDIMWTNNVIRGGAGMVLP